MTPPGDLPRASGGRDESTPSPGSDPLVLPERAKLPLPRPPQGPRTGPLPPALEKAWTDYMVNGFRQNEQMFEATLQAFLKPYQLTIWLYASLFAVGIGLFLAAALIGLRDGSSVVAVVFAGLGAAAFLAFFIRQPLQALEENLQCITWLGVAFNTYWTRLMYLGDADAIQAGLKAADDDFRASVEKLIALHAELRGKRPGG
jgi:hypothetical protein